MLHQKLKHRIYIFFFIQMYLERAILTEPAATVYTGYLFCDIYVVWIEHFLENPSRNWIKIE